MEQKFKFKELVSLCHQTHEAMQQRAARSVNIERIVWNGLFGWYIVEFENGGAERADIYGKQLIEKLSDMLSKELGKGFSKRSLELYRLFYLSYRGIAQTVSAQSLQRIDSEALPASLKTQAVSDELIQQLASQFRLGWSHYVSLLSMNDPDERRFYEIEASENSWRSPCLKLHL